MVIVAAAAVARVPGLFVDTRAILVQLTSLGVCKDAGRPQDGEQNYAQPHLCHRW